RAGKVAETPLRVEIRRCRDLEGDHWIEAMSPFVATATATGAAATRLVLVAHRRATRPAGRWAHWRPPRC
ncbi:MAG TPA: hypothetical protein VGH93_02885, partial [Solirubrobacteraceae bacterium]